MVLSRSRIVAVHPPISGLASMQFWMLPDSLCFQNKTSIRDNLVLLIESFDDGIIPACQGTEVDLTQLKASFVVFDRDKHILTLADAFHGSFRPNCPRPPH